MRPPCGRSSHSGLARSAWNRGIRSDGHPLPDDAALAGPSSKPSRRTTCCNGGAGQWDFLGDWLWPGAEGVNGDTRETLFFNNCYWIYNLKTAAKIADVLGKKELAATYRRREDVVRLAVHKEFFNPAENGYVNNFQAYLAAALLNHHFSHCLAG
jgi:hypothetical protein